MKHPRATLAGLFLCLLTATPVLHGQASYTATRATRIQVGAGGLLLNNDYSDGYNKGVTVYGDYDFSRFAGIEADVYFGGLVTPESIGENSYLVGPRLTYRRRKATGYAKLLIGRGSITNEVYHQTSSFNAYAYGGGLEYRVGRKLNVRAFDVEVEQWPNFETHTLSPVAVTVGIAYILR